MLTAKIFKGSLALLGASLLANAPSSHEKSVALTAEEKRKDLFEEFVCKFQEDFVKMVQRYETKQFTFDKWKRSDGEGGGLTCVLQDGEFFEKAGVNTTRLVIPFSKRLADAMRERGKNYTDEDVKNFHVYANGVSLVIHPINPFVPTVHANYRYFELIDKETKRTVDWWFGGGADLTPHYLFEEDAALFHREHKQAMDPFDANLYPVMKKECDKYFFIAHRKEARGIGGIFYDDFQIAGDWDKTFEFAKGVSQAVLRGYDQILSRRRNHPYSEKHMHWKLLRRGRYVEFNLIYDRGTKFGLFTPDARIESIFMSMPLVARWEYNYEVPHGSEEAKMQEVLKNPRDWV